MIQSERNHSRPVEGRMRTKDEMWAPDTRAGDYCIHGEEDLRILCECPCGCGSFMNLPINVGEKVERKWLWDGNRERPTLHPSIRDLSGCRFHGHLNNGVWTFCGDSGVAA